MVIGVTGGIATGKSTFCAVLQRLWPRATFFDADQAARELTAHDPEVLAAIRREFGDAVFVETGELNRAALRSIVFGHAARKAALENILHPRIRQIWRAQSQPLRGAPELFVADIPLLFETGGETLCDRVVVVACSPEIQIDRLMKRSSGLGAGRLQEPKTTLTRNEAQQIIQAQMPLMEKVARADHVVWNNAGREALEAQTVLLARSWQSAT